MDHPIFLLPNIWLCSKHPGCRQHCGLPKHNTGLPATTGKKTFVFHRCEYTFSIDSAGILFEMHCNFFCCLFIWFSPITSHTKTKSLHSVICAWSSLCCSSSAVFSASRYFHLHLFYILLAPLVQHKRIYHCDTHLCNFRPILSFKSSGMIFG